MMYLIYLLYHELTRAQICTLDERELFFSTVVGKGTDLYPWLQWLKFHQFFARREIFWIFFEDFLDFLDFVFGFDDPSHCTMRLWSWWGRVSCHTAWYLVLSSGLEWDSTVVAINGEVNASCEHNYESIWDTTLVGLVDVCYNFQYLR